MKKIVYKCLNEKCKCEFADYSKEGLNCPKCSSHIVPLREASKEDVINIPTYKGVKDSNMVNKKTWDEFQNSGLLWWINMILHTFGWSIVFALDENKKIVEVYPARVRYRGFYEKLNIEGYIKVSEYINKESNQLLKESKE